MNNNGDVEKRLLKENSAVNGLGKLGMTNPTPPVF